jgi:hypothetical protein
MAAVARTAAEARPTNDHLTLEVTMAVAVQAGQLVYIKADGKGALANAGAAGTMPARGVATMDCPAGRAVALCVYGKFGGWSGLTPGVTLNASGTAGELDTAAGTVPQKVGFAVSSTDVFINPDI